MDITRKANYCKICFTRFYPSTIREIIEGDPLICDNCISKIIKKLETRKIKGTKITFLSEYNGLLKDMLMNYKEYGDIELAPCFLYTFIGYIMIKFPFATFIPCPSSQSRIDKRGYSHLVEILKASKLKCLDCLTKGEGIEQKNTKAVQRLADKKIRIKEGITKIDAKRVVLFDDVYTSGSTFFQSKEALERVYDGKIEGLILLDNDKTSIYKLT